jgi:hypothetical protein
MKIMKKCLTGLCLGLIVSSCVFVPAAAAELPASAYGDMPAANDKTSAANDITSAGDDKTSAANDITSGGDDKTSAAGDDMTSAAALPSDGDGLPASSAGYTEDVAQAGQADEDKSISETDVLALAVYYLYSPVSGQNLLPEDFTEHDFVQLYDDDGTVVACYMRFSNGAYIIVNNNKDNPFAAEYGTGRSAPLIESIRERNPGMEIVYDGWHGVRGRDFDSEDAETEAADINYHVCYPQAGDKDVEQMEILSLALGMVKDGTLNIDERWVKDKVIDAFVRRLYDTCLGRKADDTGFKAWKTALYNGVRASKVVKGFFYSDEYAAKKKESMQYIMDLYMAFVGRIFDAKGYQSWNEAMYYGATRDQVFRGFARSEEFKKFCRDSGLMP